MKTILVVEDDADLRELLKFNFESRGYTVICAKNAEMGMGSFRSELAFAPDLVLLDVMLPGINGLDACKCLRYDSLIKNVPIIMMSAKTEQSDIDAGFNAGATAYITKPFSIRELVEKVAELVN